MHLKKSCYPIVNYFKGYIDLKVDNKDIDAMLVQAKNILSEEKISPAFKAIFEILISIFATEHWQLVYALHFKMRSIEEVQSYAMGVIRGKKAIFPLIASANEFVRSIQSRLYRSNLQVRSVYTMCA